jgi:hypothetical protein
VGERSFGRSPTFTACQTPASRYGPIDDLAYVVVDLEFDTGVEAETFSAALRNLWRRAEADGLLERPRARIVEEVESKEY